MLSLISRRWLMVWAALAILAMPALSSDPVQASPAEALSPPEQMISNIFYELPSPNILQFGQSLNIDFDYSTTASVPVRIFARPMTNGDLSPNYGAHGSPVYPPDATTGSGSFTITSGEDDVVVDEIRFQIVDADSEELLQEFFLPVYFVFTGSTNAVHSLLIDKGASTLLILNHKLFFNFRYNADSPGGVRIFVRPMTNGEGTPNYAAHASPLYPVGQGDASGDFSISAGETLIDQVRFQIYAQDNVTLLKEYLLPVSYQVSPAQTAVYNLILETDTPNSMNFGENVNLTFAYQTGEAGGVRIFTRPMTHGVNSPDYAAHASPLYPTGSGTGSGYFTIQSTDVTVDGIRIQAFNADNTTLLFEKVIPVHYRFGHGEVPLTLDFSLFVPAISR